jgi:hypothetical protein
LANGTGRHALIFAVLTTSPASNRRLFLIGEKMKITVDTLRAKGACNSGIEYFSKTWPEGGNYQAVIDKCVEDKKIHYADWLLSKIGAIDATLEIDEFDGDYLYFAGMIKVSKSIKVKFSIKAGLGIKAGSGIKAGLGIEAGSGIKAGWGIEAGSGIKAGWGIEAGSGIKAGRGIEAGSDIKAGWGIEAGLQITAKSLDCKLRIFAGLCNWKIPGAQEQTIIGEIRSGVVAHGIIGETNGQNS